MTRRPPDMSGQPLPPAPVRGEDTLASFLLTALDAAGELMLIRGPTGRVAHVNQAFIDAFGGSLRDWVGRWFSVAPPAGTDGSRRYEMLMRTQKGALWIEWDERLLPDSRGVIAVGRDITSRRESHDSLEASQRAKSLFFAAVTHELRTPLAGAMGVARLLKATPLRPDQADYVRSLAASAEHALAMIDDILDLSRLEAGKLNLRPESVDLAALLAETVEPLATRAQDKGLELSVVHTAGAPQRVTGDKARLKQILFNLIGNAVKFTDSGGIRVEIGNTPDADGRARLSLAVCDTGPGISEADQASLFEHFERGAAERDGKEAGAGLGLAMVRRLVEAMTSSMGVESRLGEGARFWVLFDLPVESSWSEQPLAGREMAVAAPNPVLRRALADQISALGGDVVAIDNPDRIAAASGRELLLDSAWADLAATASPAHCWVLLEPREKDAFLENRPQGVDGWLVKPVRRSTLIAQVCGHPQAQGESDESATGPDEPPRLDGLTVLVAEDDPVNALIARRTLEKLGAVVRAADTGVAALKAFEDGPVDAALLDQRMPGMDGPDLARMLRLQGCEVPLIALTANSSEEDRQICLEAGMDDFLTKPVEPLILATTLNRLCGQKKRSSLG
ncbi:response regulator [Maricaulis sp.]|uniref:response regulator n=1 Tax=Maricaulis sp. TaxID=1486257 RepID=UPI002611F536|nr:response regulator [Maricaulis sp.]